MFIKLCSIVVFAVLIGTTTSYEECDGLEFVREGHKPVLPVNYDQSGLFAKLSDPQICNFNPNASNYWRDYNIEIERSDGVVFQLNLTFSCYRNCTCPLTKVVTVQSLFGVKGDYENNFIFIFITYKSDMADAGNYKITWVQEFQPPICEVGSITIKKCELVSDRFKVVSDSSSYKENGTVLCKNGQMFNDDLPSSDIKAWCNENAVWSFKSEKLHCYRAPNSVSIYFPQIINENEEVEIRCLFSNEGNPQPNQVKFYIGNRSYTRDANEVLKKNITALDDFKKAYCQVVNAYTEQFKNQGKSDDKTLNVHFHPILQQNFLKCEIIENAFTKKCSFKIKSNPQYRKDLHAYNVVNNKEKFNYLTTFLKFKTSEYDHKSREQTIELTYNEWLRSGNFSVHVEGNKLRLMLVDERKHGGSNLPVENEKVQCHFNDKGIFIEPCKIEVPTEKLINENQIRVFEVENGNSNETDIKIIKIEPTGYNFTAEIQTFEVCLTKNLTKELSYEILFDQQKLIYLDLLKEIKVETTTMKSEIVNTTAFTVVPTTEASTKLENTTNSTTVYNTTSYITENNTTTSKVYNTTTINYGTNLTTVYNTTTSHITENNATTSKFYNTTITNYGTNSTNTTTNYITENNATTSKIYNTTIINLGINSTNNTFITTSETPTTSLNKALISLIACLSSFVACVVFIFLVKFCKKNCNDNSDGLVITLDSDTDDDSSSDEHEHFRL